MKGQYVEGFLLVVDVEVWNVYINNPWNEKTLSKL